MAFVRAKGPDGSEFTIDEAAVAGLGAEVVDKDAVDVNGRPLPAKPRIDIAQLAGGDTVPVLQKFAADQQIDLGDATKKDDITAVLENHLQES